MFVPVLIFSYMHQEFIYSITTTFMVFIHIPVQSQILVSKIGVLKLWLCIQSVHGKLAAIAGIGAGGRCAPHAQNVLAITTVDFCITKVAYPEVEPFSLVQPLLVLK